MNTLLIAAFEDDVDFIDRNLHLAPKNKEIQILEEACYGGAMNVMKYMVENVLDLQNCNLTKAVMVASIYCNFKKRYKVIKYLLDLGVENSTNYHPALYVATKRQDATTVFLLLRYKICDKNNICLRQTILKNNLTLFYALWPKDNIVKSELLKLAVSLKCFEMALFIHEKANVQLDAFDNEGERSKFIKYRDIIQRTRIRAVNKISQWWIPICYKLTDENGENRMAVKSWKRVEKYSKEFSS